MQLKVASLLALLVASATSLQRSISPKAPLTLRRYNRGVSEPSSVLDAKVSLEVIMGRKPGSCTGTYNTMAREHDAVILGEDQEGDVWLFAVHGPFLVKGMIRLALEGYTQTPLAAHHEPSAGYLHPYAYVCAETLKTLPRFDHLQHKVASIIKVGLVENGKAVIEEAVKGHRAALCMSPCVRQAFAQGFVCAVDPANADTQVFTSFTYTNAKTLLPIEIMLEDYARPLCEKTKTDAVYLKRGDYAGIFDLWINDEEVGNLLSDWEQKVCCKEYVGISSSGTVTNHGSGFNMKDGYSRTLETGAPLGIWNMGKDADGLMTLDAVVIGAECFLDLCETSKWLTGGEPIVEMMPTEDWGTGKYNPKTQKTETIPIFPRELEGDFVRDASTGKLYRKQFNPWGKYQWNPRDDLDVAACRFDWVDCEACAKNRRVKGAIFIEGGDGFEFLAAHETHNTRLLICM